MTCNWSERDHNDQCLEPAQTQIMINKYYSSLAHYWKHNKPPIVYVVVNDCPQLILLFGGHWRPLDHGRQKNGGFLILTVRIRDI